jgi:hypothetical protein
MQSSLLAERTMQLGPLLSLSGVSNYLFWEGFVVVVPKKCFESRCLKKQRFERG